MKISILCPTRKRSASMQRLWNSIVDTAKDLSKIELVFYIDDDDKDSINQFENMKSHQIKASFGPRLPIGSDMWNKAYENATGEIFMLCGDDIIFRSKNWDSIVRNEFLKVCDRILYVYGNDGLRKDDLGTHGFVHQNWIDVTGYFTPPYFTFYYVDRWLTDVGQNIGRARFLKDSIYTEHVHFANRKAVLDDTYKERRHMQKESKPIFLKESKGKKQIDIKKLLQFIEKFHKEAPKIFCIGLPRTGTATLASINGALSFVGCERRTIHQSNVLLSKYPSIENEIYDKYISFADFPIPALYKELDKKYPNSKFIATIRNIDNWLDSYEFMFNWKYKSWKEFVHRFHENFYGTREFNRDLFRKKFISHYNEIAEYFAGRTGDVLILPLEEFGWKKLCEFLKSPIPDLEFPHVNKRETLMDLQRKHEQHTDICNNI